MQSSWQISVYSPRMACVRISGDCKSYEMLIPDQRPYLACGTKQQTKYKLTMPYDAHSKPQTNHA
ncbi:hypothetical protein [Neiella holothuriorum]|uniref:hypothetical protein n=1 Tax=Neiella holothuriorum TaxID=2870530 RepID=UPI001C66E584|nr:hypothetical protein [Neiella holothuriorum]